jgi:hypothetical protein
LAQEAETRRAGSFGANSKRVLNREVSMSRVFKVKQTRDKEKEKSTINRSDSKAVVNKKDFFSEGVVTLVEATPVKKIKELSSASQKEQRPGLGPCFLQPMADRKQEEEEDIWYLPSSPDVLLLGETENVSSDEQIVLSEKPIRKGRRRRNK